jgi:hypothetical protein
MSNLGIIQRSAAAVQNALCKRRNNCNKVVATHVACVEKVFEVVRLEVQQGLGK